MHAAAELPERGGDWWMGGAQERRNGGTGCMIGDNAYICPPSSNEVYT